jgi:hypothetical protein
MPQAIPLAVGLGASAAAGAAAAAGTATFIGLNAVAWSAISVGLSIAGTLAQTLLAEQPPKPKMQDGDVSIKQAIPSRTRMYGRQRLGGVYLYYDSTSEGDLKTLVCHCAHEVDDSTAERPNPEEDWLNDERVQLDGDGNVTDDPWWQDGSGLGDEGHSAVVIRHYLGAPTQDIPTFDEKWTAQHKAHGLCCAYVKYADLKDEDQIKVFPSGPPPYRVVLRGAKVFDPRLEGTDPGDHDPDDEATWTWSDNAALVVLDYLTRLERGVPVGFGIPLAGPAGRIDLGSFKAAADICDQLVALKAGGTEKRWRAWGAYELTEDKKAVLQDLLDACGGRLIQGPDGKLGLAVGAPGPAAAVTLTEEQILEWDLNQGKPAIERINEVRATYVAQAWEWAETEAGIQLDQAAIDRNGVESSQIKLRFVPSESQAQRVAREVLRRGNPSHAGRIRTTLAGLDAWGERWIRLQIAELGIDAVFEIMSMRLNQADMTVELEVTSYDNWWEWSAATDEQDPAVPPPDGDDDAGVPVPEAVSVTIAHRFYNAQTPVAVGVITWGPPPRSVYVAKARYRKVSADPQNPFPWQPLPVAQDDDQVETFPLQDGTAYEAQVRFIGPRGAGSDWSTPPATFTAVADPVAPASPTSLTAQANAPATGQVTVSATAPNDPRHLSLRFYRNGSSSFAGATLINGPLYCAPLSAQTCIDMPAAGDWWYFATSSNWSNVASAPAGGVMAEVSPAAPVITSPTATIGQTNPTVSGTGPAGVTIKVFANAVLNATTAADGSGNWSVTLIALGSGAQAITATATVGGNESPASGSVTLTVVWYDPDASGHADFKGGNYRLNGAGSTLAGIFDTITTSATFVTHADGSLHAVAANAAPISDRGLELWENRTNRCTNRNAKPIDLTGVTASGAGTAGGVTLVNDSAAMAGGILAALLAGTDINGSVFKLDNSTGVSDAFVTISGPINVTGACRGSVVYRGSAGQIEIGGITAVSFGASTHYARVGGSRTAAAASEQMRIAAPAGAVIYFILNQLEAGAFDTAPIVVNAAIATRNAPQIQRTAGVDFNATEGFFGARAKVAAGATNSGVIVGSIQTTIGDANVIQAVTTTAMRGLTQVASAATGLASQPLAATNTTTALYGYKANDFGFSANGLTTVTDTSGALPSGTPAKITVSLNVIVPLNGIVEQVKWGTTKPASATIQAKSGWTTVT